jgi:hypothetical protein
MREDPDALPAQVELNAGDRIVRRFVPITCREAPAGPKEAGPGSLQTPGPGKGKDDPCSYREDVTWGCALRAPPFPPSGLLKRAWSAGGGAGNPGSAP